MAKIENRTKIIPLEKILTISATEYCSMAGKSLNDYTAIGVYGPFLDSLNAPARTEVIVGYQNRPCTGGIGTALI